MKPLPTTLDALYEQARADLGALKPGVLLDWAWLNAQAVGAVEGARMTLKAMESNDSEIRSRRMSYLPIDEITDRRLEAMEHGYESLATQRRKVEMWAAYVRATEHVMALLERVATKAKRSEESKAERPKAA